MAPVVYYTENYQDDPKKLIDAMELSLSVNDEVLVFKNDKCIISGGSLDGPYKYPWSDWQFYYATAHDVYYGLNPSKVDK